MKGDIKMTDVGMTKITIKKGQGLTHALRDLVKSQKMKMSDDSISAAEWNKTIDKLTELQEKRKAAGKDSIFTGGTDRADFRGSFVVHPNQEINFTEEEMKELYEAMGVSFAKAEETEVETEPTVATEQTDETEPTAATEPTEPAAKPAKGNTDIRVGDNNGGPIVIIDGPNQQQQLNRRRQPNRQQQLNQPLQPNRQRQLNRPLQLNRQRQLNRPLQLNRQMLQNLQLLQKLHNPVQM